MDQPTVLRTAKVGGFVKEDVLTYVDELNSKIYGLEEELKEVREKASAPAQDSAQIQKLENEIKQLRTDLGTANAGLRKAQEELDKASKNAGGDAQVIAENEQLRQELNRAKASLAELEQARTQVQTLQAENDVLKKENAAQKAEIESLQQSLAAKPEVAPAPVDNSENDLIVKQTLAQLTEKTAEIQKKDSLLAEKDKNIESLNKKIEQLESDITELKNNAEEAAVPSSFDMGAMFAEAQMVAKKVTIEAKNAADRMTKEAKEQAESIVNEANAQAERRIAETEEKIDATIAEANETARKTIEEANEKAKTANMLSGTVRGTLNGEIDGVAKKLNEITELINKLSAQANERLDEAQSVIKTAKSEIGETDNKEQAFDMPDPAAADQLKAKLNAPMETAKPAEEKPKSDQQGNAADKNKAVKKPANFGFDLDDLAKAVEEAAKSEGGDTGNWGSM